MLSTIQTRHKRSWLGGWTVWVIVFGLGGLWVLQSRASVGGWPGAAVVQKSGDVQEEEEVAWNGWEAISHVFVFGDSWTNTWFDREGEQPTPEMPFGNQNQLGGQKNLDPPKWINYLINAHPLARPLTYNLAMPTATVDRDVYEPRAQGVWPVHGTATLKEQLDLFDDTYVTSWKVVQNWERSSTLFALWFGINDVADANGRLRHIPSDAIFASYSASIYRLIAHGARNILLLNVPPIDRTLGDPSGSLTWDIWDYNHRLSQLRAKHLRRHPSATILLFDAHRLYTDALDRPELFDEMIGVKNFTGWCEGYAMGTSTPDQTNDPTCGAPYADYFWQNILHPTHRIHALTAARIQSDCFAKEGPKGYCTYNTLPAMGAAREGAVGAKRRR